MKNFLLNTTEEPVKRRHISWSIKTEPESIILYEIEECYYRHPQAPNDAIIGRIEENERIRCHLQSAAASPLLVLLHTLNTITTIFGTGEENEKQTTIEMGTKKV